MPTPPLSSSLLPNREPVLEYGLGVVPADGLVVVEARRFGLLGVKPGRTPRWLCERDPAGVGARFGGCFLNGDSGRGNDGLLGLKLGLVGRAPVPTVLENWDLENCERDEGVSTGAVYAGVGDESKEAAGESCRFSARCTGRKMPAPGMDVWK